MHHCIQVFQFRGVNFALLGIPAGAVLFGDVGADETKDLEQDCA